MTDTITQLRTVSGARMTKRWRADGTIEGYQDAKTFSVHEESIWDLDSLADVLQGMRNASDACVIRGAYPPDKRSRVHRNTESTWDKPHHWCMIDIDGYEPLFSDPVTEPVAAILEFVGDKLPPEFGEASFYWQLSSSAGAPGKGYVLKAHLWYWLESPCDSPTLRAWAKKLPGVDSAVFRQVQPHYVADPLFEAGVADPVPARAGLHRGAIEAVPLDLGYVPAAAGVAPDGADVDLDKLRGAVEGYDLDRVRDEIMVHLDPSMHHDEWVNVGMALHHQFDGDAEALELWDDWSSGGASWHDAVCAERWPSFAVDRMAGTGSITLRYLMKLTAGERKTAVVAASASAGQPGIGLTDKVIGAVAAQLDMKVDACAREIGFDAGKYDATLGRIAWDAVRAQYRIMTADGSLLLAARADAANMLAQRDLAGFYDRVALDVLARKRGPLLAVPITGTKLEKWADELAGEPMRKLLDSARNFRQFTTIAATVDPFAASGGVSLHDGTSRSSMISWLCWSRPASPRTGRRRTCGCTPTRTGASRF